MIFSDRDLLALIKEGRLVVEPFDPDSVQPSSIDLRVGSQFRVFANSRYPYIDVRRPMDDLTELVEASDEEPFILHPGEFVLAATFERVSLPDDVVGRLEGKSSLGRLGLLIHSSLPGGEPILVRTDTKSVKWVAIEDVVRKQIAGQVVSFDPATFEVGYHQITGWYEGPPDRIYEVVLSSGRRIRVTAGHNLFTIDCHGELAKVRTAELAPGTRVAIPRRLPGPSHGEVEIDLLELAPESDMDALVLKGPAIGRLFDERRAEVGRALQQIGIRHGWYYREREQLPARVALAFDGLRGSELKISVRGSNTNLPTRFNVGDDIAWLIGLYVAEGYRRARQVVWSNTDQTVLDRVERTLRRLGLTIYRSEGAITCSSALLSRIVGWIGPGDGLRAKRIPPMVFSWPDGLIRSFLEGFVDGDGSRRGTQLSLWTSSPGLVTDFLALLPRLGLRAGASTSKEKTGVLYQISVPYQEHELLTSVPLSDRLLVRIRESLGLSQAAASRMAGYKRATNLCDVERRSSRDAVRLETLRRLLEAYTTAGAAPLIPSLARLTNADLLWDEVIEVNDTGSVETIFDLEVRPNGRKVENFLAGSGGVFVSNTAGFVDAGFQGYLTLELSNVANLPITIYPGMKIGQISLFQMTSAADRPYGSDDLGSKYLGQKGPTPSRYYENFNDR